MRNFKQLLALLFTTTFINFSLTSCGEIDNKNNIPNEQENNQESDNNDTENNNNDSGDDTENNVDDTSEGSERNPIEISITEAKTIASGLAHDTLTDKYYKCSGTVTQLVLEPNRTEFILNNGTQNIKVYYIENLSEYSKIKNKDTVTIVGRLKNYGGNKEFHRVKITSLIPDTSSPEIVRKSINVELFNDTTIPYKTIAELNKLASALPEDPTSTGTPEKYYVKGFVNELITTSNYHHFLLSAVKDGGKDNRLFINVSKKAYNDLETKYEINDEVILYGSLKHSNNGPQMYQAEIKALRIHN